MYYKYHIQIMRVVILSLFLTVGFSGFVHQKLIANSASAKSSYQGKKLRVLLIGNSFSQNASTYLQQISAEMGNQLILGHAELGGCSLQKHWELAAIANADSTDTRGKAYAGKSLQMLLREGIWDVVSMQQYSLLSANVDSYFPYIQNLYDLIKMYQPKAQIVLHQTWAYRSDSKPFGKISDQAYALSEKEMYEKSRAAYHAVAGKLKLKIIPTGDAFWKMDQDEKWGFKRDSLFDFKQNGYPALPKQDYSLHVGYTWDKEKKLIFDTHHASSAGKYLGSLVWYKFLFKDSISKIQFKPVGISEEFAIALKKCVMD